MQGAVLHDWYAVRDGVWCRRVGNRAHVRILGSEFDPWTFARSFQDVYAAPPMAGCLWVLTMIAAREGHAILDFERIE